jgi:hypothetical protein
MSSQVIEGVVNFSNVTKHDVYNGQDTGRVLRSRTTRALNSVSLSRSTPLVCTMLKAIRTQERFRITPVCV